MAKVLLTVLPDEMRDLSENHPETGMGFQVVQGSSGFVIVLEERTGLPCYPDPRFYDVSDLLAGNPVPVTRGDGRLTPTAVHPNRPAAITALQALTISPAYTGTAGAVPLIASHTLSAPKLFYRCLRATADPRFVGGKLTSGTYLTTKLDVAYANSGFATVGRFALPIPLPACHVIHYELPAGATINVGTVAPMFGQSGGGVEVQVPASQPAVQVRSSTVPEY